MVYKALGIYRCSYAPSCFVLVGHISERSKSATNLRLNISNECSLSSTGQDHFLLSCLRSIETESVATVQ